MTDPYAASELPFAERPPTRRGIVMAATGLTASFVMAAVTAIPAPYALSEPGPTLDTLSESDGVALLEIEGQPTFDSTGELRLTTVSVTSAAGQPFSVGRVIQGFFSPAREVLPVEYVYGDPAAEEDEEALSAQQWMTSQEAAAVAALELRGEVIPAVLTIVETAEDSNAAGLLLANDVITGMDGKEFVSYSQLSEYMDSREPGQTVEVSILRDGEPLEVSFELKEAEDGSAIMGIFLVPTFDLPVDVTVNVDYIGGPSAGTMFALAILDKLTEDDELNGAKVAGTGTMDVAGNVGAIGGIPLKMMGARLDGAEYFLAPVDNCAEVVGHIPAGLDVYAVGTLDEAFAAIVAIGKEDTSKLSTCESYLDSGD